MTWKVNYNDIIRVPQEKWRMSMTSLIRRNSQRVNANITFCRVFNGGTGNKEENAYLRFGRLIFFVVFPSG